MPSPPVFCWEDPGTGEAVGSGRGVLSRVSAERPSGSNHTWVMRMEGAGVAYRTLAKLMSTPVWGQPHPKSITLLFLPASKSPHGGNPWHGFLLRLLTQSV